MSSREPFDELESELLALGDLIDVPNPPPSDVAASIRTRLESTPGSTTPSTSPETAPTLDAGGDAGPLDAAPAPEAAPAPGPEAGPISDGEPGAGDGAGGSDEAGAELAGGPDPAHGPHATPVRPHTRRPGRRTDRRRPPGRRGRWKVVTAVVVVVIAITAATPQGRAAVQKILRFAGVELHIGDTPPPPVTTTAPLPDERTVSPSEVPSRAKFPVRTPARLGAPQRTSVSDNGRLVSMFWPDGIRLDQFDGAMDPYFFKKLGPPFPDYVDIGPYQAWWIPGEHPLGYIRREDGTAVPLRQAAATLIWQQDGINHRLEGVRTKEEAVRIAESLQ